MQSEAHEDSVQGSTGCKATTSTQSDNENNLRTLALQLNGVTLYPLLIPICRIYLIVGRYGQFAEYAIIDEKVQVVQFTYNQTENEVVVEIPHFWEIAEFDPNFQVLVEYDKVAASCNSVVAGKSNSLRIQSVTPLNIFCFFDFSQPYQ